MGRYDRQDADTFGGGYHRRVQRSETFHGRRAAQDSASFDNDSSGAGCAPFLVLLFLGLLGAVLGAVSGG